MGCIQILNYFPYFQGELSAGLRAYWIAFASCRIFKPSPPRAEGRSILHTQYTVSD